MTGMPERWAFRGFQLGGIEYRLEIAMAAEAAQDGFVCVVGVVCGQQDKRSVACKVSDGTEQLALVFGRIVVDNGNFGMAVVAEAVEPVGGCGGA